MLLNIKKYVDRPEIRELLSYSVFPDPEELELAVLEYKNNPDLQLGGLESEKEIIAVIGYRHVEEGTIEVKHLAVRPDCRGAGFGRGLLLELIAKEKPKRIVAETDEETVEFFRNVGFEIRSLGEKFPGAEKFLCSFQTEVQEEAGDD